MKKELKIIFANELYSKEYRDDLMEYFEQVYSFYDTQTENATKKIEKFLRKYSFENLLSDDRYDCPRLLLFHGSDNFEFFPRIQDNGIYPHDEEIGSIVPNLPYEYCESAYGKGYDEDEILDREIQIQISVIFIWLSKIWIKVNGANHGRIMSTLENGVTSEFVFNDLNWHNETVFKEPIHKSIHVGPYFNREVSVLELYKRVMSNNSIDYKEFLFGNEITQLLIGDEYIICKEKEKSYEVIRFLNFEEKENWLEAKEEYLKNNGATKLDLNEKGYM